MKSRVSASSRSLALPRRGRETAGARFARLRRGRRHIYARFPCRRPRRTAFGRPARLENRLRRTGKSFETLHVPKPPPGRNFPSFPMLRSSLPNPAGEGRRPCAVMGRRAKRSFSPPCQDCAKCASRILRRVPKFGAVAPSPQGSAFDRPLTFQFPILLTSSGPLWHNTIVVWRGFARAGPCTFF